MKQLNCGYNLKILLLFFFIFSLILTSCNEINEEENEVNKEDIDIELFTQQHEQTQQISLWSHLQRYLTG